MTLVRYGSVPVGGYFRLPGGRNIWRRGDRDDECVYSREDYYVGHTTDQEPDERLVEPVIVADVFPTQ